MKRKRIAVRKIILVIGVNLFLAHAAWADTMTMVTYEPGNSSTFDRLHAKKMTVGSAYDRTNIPDDNARLTDGRLLVSGQLGIGTTTPLTKLVVEDNSTLDVRGSTSAQTSNDALGAVLNLVKERLAADGTTILPSSTGDIAGRLRYWFYNTAVAPTPMEGASIQSQAVSVTAGDEAADLEFSTMQAGVAAERVHISPNGFVGIGTANPTTQMDVRSATSQAAVLISGAGDANNTYSALYLDDSVPDLTNNWVIAHKKAIGTPLQDALHIGYWVDPATLRVQMALQPNGNIGIGTVTPSALLDVNGVTATNYLRVNPQDAVSVDEGGEIQLVGAGSGGAKFPDWFADLFQDRFRLISGGAEKFTVTSAGNVGIRTVNPGLPLDVNGDSIFRGNVTTGSFVTMTGIRTYILGYDQGGYHWLMSGGTAEPTFNALGFYPANRYIYVGNGWTLQGNIQNTGPSDIRLKKEIIPIPDALGKISALRGVNFRWIDPKQDSGLKVGVIAQEVEKVFPDLVFTNEDGMKAVDYPKLVAPLIESVKELKTQNDELKKRVETLEKKLEEKK